MSISTNSLTAQIGADISSFQAGMSGLVTVVGGAMSKINGTLNKLNSTLQQITNMSQLAMGTIERNAAVTSGNVAMLGTNIGKSFGAGSKTAVTSVDNVTKSVEKLAKATTNVKPPTVAVDTKPAMNAIDALQKKLATLKPIGTEYASTDRGMKSLVDRAMKSGVQPDFKSMTDFLAQQQVNINGGAAGLGTKFSIEYRKALSIMEQDTLKMQALIDKAIKAGVQPTFKSMVDFLMSEGIRLDGATKGFGTKFSIEYKKSLDKMQSDTKTAVDNIVKETSKIIPISTFDPNASGNVRIPLPNVGMKPNLQGLGMNAVPRPESPLYMGSVKALKEIKDLQKEIADMPLDANAKKFLLTWEKSLAEAKKLEAEIGKILKTYEPLFTRMLSQVPPDQQKEVRRALIGGLTEGIKKSMEEPFSLWKSMFKLLKEEAADFATYASYRFGIVGRLAVHTVQGLAKIIAERKAATAALESSGGGGGGSAGGVLGILGGQGGAASLGLIVGLTAAVTALTAAAAGAALVFGKKFADAAALTTEKMSDMSRVVGISVEGMSALTHVAAMQGESIEGLQTTFIQLSDKMQEAAGGNELMIKKFEMMGVNVIDPTTGKVKSLMQILFELSDEMNRLGNTSDRNAKLMELITRQGMAKFIKMFGGGSELLKKIMNEAEKFNKIQTKEDEERAEAYLKQMREYDAAWEGLGKTIMGVVAGPLAYFYNLLTDIVNHFANPKFDPYNLVGGEEGLKKLESRLSKMFSFIGIGPSFPTPKTSAATPDSPDSPDSPHTTGGIEGPVGSTLAERILENEKQSNKVPSATQLVKWDHDIQDVTRSLRDQTVAIEEQIIALSKGSLEAKKYSMVKKFEADIALKIQREGLPPEEAAKQRAAFNKGLTELMTKQEAFNKLMGTDWETEKAERIKTLMRGFRDLNNTIADTTTFVDPAEKAVKDYTRSLEGLEKQTEDLLKTAKRELALKVMPDPEGIAMVKSLEGTLQNIREKLKDPIKIRIDIDKKALDEMTDTRKKEIENLILDSKAQAAVTAEQRIQVAIERDILELRRRGVSESTLQSQALKDQLATQERIKDQLLQAQKFDAAMKGKRENIEDMMLEVQATAAITSEEKLQIVIQKELLSYKRQRIELTKEQEAEVRVLAAAQQEVEAVLKRQQELYSTIDKAIDSALENTQSAFADALNNAFSPKKGESFGKNFVVSILKGWQQAFSQIAGALQTALFDQMFGSEGGVKGAIMGWLKKMGIGKLGETAQQKVDNAKKAIVDSEARTAQMFRDSVARFDSAVSKIGNIPSTATPQSPGPFTDYKDGGIVTGEAPVFSDSVFQNMANNLDSEMNEVLQKSTDTATREFKPISELTTQLNNMSKTELERVVRSGQLETRVQELQNEIVDKSRTTGDSFSLAVAKFAAAVDKFSGGSNGPPPQQTPGASTSSSSGGDNILHSSNTGDVSWAYDWSAMGDALDQQMSESMGNALTNTFAEKAPQQSGDWSKTLEYDLNKSFGAFLEFAKGGFKDFGTFMKTILTDVFKMLMGGGGGGGLFSSGSSGGLFGMGGNLFGGGGMLGGLFGGGGGASFGFGSAPAGVAGPAMANGGFFSTAGGWLSSLFMEKGGIIPSTGLDGIITRPTIMHYAKGGIAPATGLMGAVAAPTMVSLGENAPNEFEAVVPLPDNRSIPVKMIGGGGGGGGGGSSAPQDSNHSINLEIAMSTPVVDPTVFQPSAEQIIRHVKADYDGGGSLRTSIREDLGRG